MLRHLFLFAVLPLPVFADTIEVTPTVRSALVTGQSGIVTYSADVALPEGRHQVTLRLPTEGGNGVTGIRLPTGVVLVGQTFNSSRATPADRVLTPRQSAARDARIAAEAALAAHQAKRAEIEAQIAAARVQVTLAEQTAKSGLTGDKPPTAAELTAMAAALAETMQAAQAQISRLQPVLLALNPETVALTEARDRAIAAEDALIAEDVQRSGLLTLTVDASGTVDGSLEIDNREPVYWSPRYSFDLRHDGDQGTLTIHRQAVVSHTTSYGSFAEPLYPWADIKLTLTTASLSDQTQTAIPRPQPKSLADKTVRKQVTSRVYSEEPEPAELVIVAEEVSLDEYLGRVTYTGQSVEFDLGSGHSLDPYADQSSFDIDTVSLPVSLFAMANAARDSHAFLYTNLTNESAGILLAGSGLLKVNGAIIGDISLPKLLPGQEEPMGLGPLHGIRLDRRTVSVQEGEGGIITSRSEVERAFTTEITSALDYAIDLRLLDVVPTSENEDLVITATTRPRPQTDRRDGKRGVLEWVLPMAPGAAEQVAFGYTMKWPADVIPVDK
ncbi:MAG: DUF4139 domain-containing protein [Pseudomonadota bacterium]